METGEAVEKRGRGGEVILRVEVSWKAIVRGRVEELRGEKPNGHRTLTK